MLSLGSEQLLTAGHGMVQCQLLISQEKTFCFVGKLLIFVFKLILVLIKRKLKLVTVSSAHDIRELLFSGKDSDRENDYEMKKVSNKFMELTTGAVPASSSAAIEVRE